MPGENSEKPVELAKQITKAPMALVEFLKKYWFMGPILFLFILGIGMAIKPWFTSVVTTMGPDGKTPATIPGDKLPTIFKNFLRISGLLFPVGCLLLSGEYAFAACAGGAPCGVHSSGLLTQIWHFVAGLLASGGLAMGIAHLSAPDVLDGVTMPGQGKSIAYTPGVAQELSLYMQTTTKNKTAGGQALIAVDSVVAMDTTVEQVSTGTEPILSQDLSVLLDYLQISSLFHGTILDKVTGTGPVLDRMINYVGQGYGMWGDAPSVAITVPDTDPNDVPITKYFVFPWAQRGLSDPSATCPWLRTLDNMRFQIGVAPATRLGGIGAVDVVSAGALTKEASFLRLGTSYAISPHMRQNYIPYARLDQPASGADGLIFQNFGGTGPSCTKEKDLMLGLAWLSKWGHLPGNMDFSTLTNLIAPDFGLDDVGNLDMLVLARRKAQDVTGRHGESDFASDGNYIQGTPNNGAALNALLAFWLREPGIGMIPKMLPAFGGDTKPKARGIFNTARTGPDAFLSLSLRELSGPKMKEQVGLAAAAGLSMPAEYGRAQHFRAKPGQTIPVA